MVVVVLAVEKPVSGWLDTGQGRPVVEGLDWWLIDWGGANSNPARVVELTRGVDCLTQILVG
jgi:hypothetical protein